MRVNIKEIRYYDRPPRLGGSALDLSVEEFEKKLNITYREDIDYGEVFSESVVDMKESIEGSLSSEELKVQLKRILSSHAFNDLAVCNMGEGVGHGVFAQNNIPKDRVLCFFSGQFSKITDKNEEGEEGFAFFSSNFMFKTGSFRGIASLLQHLPRQTKMNVSLLRDLLRSIGQEVSEEELKLEDELYAVNFEANQVNLAVENVRLEHIIFDGRPVIVVVSNASIKAGEQLGFKYGFRYWDSRHKVPELFDLQGSIFPRECYKRTFYRLKFKGFSYIGDLQPLLTQVNSASGNIRFIDDKGYDRNVPRADVIDELIRVNGMYKKEVPPMTAGVFWHPEKSRLVKKYGLPDDSISCLEKGLRMAANNGQQDDITLFYGLLKNVNASDTGVNKRTALHWASIKGHLRCIFLLLKYGADPNVQDANGMTPLHCAAKFGHMDCYAELAECRATNKEITDNDCRSPEWYRSEHLLEKLRSEMSGSF